MNAGRLGLASTGLSVLCTFIVAVSGPSVMEPVLPGAAAPPASPAQPPWAFDLHLSAYLAVGLTALGVVAGTAGLILLLRASRDGWSVNPRAVLLAGLFAAVVLTLVPPFGSSDPLSYAAYGRMVATGHNPYLTTPAQLAAHGDPVARAVQDWYGQPSVYGPLASGIQALASLIGGTSVRLTVFVLGLANLLTFGVTALLLYRMSGGRQRRLRAMLLWTANPLLLQVLIAGGHIDTQQIVFCVAAVAALPHRGGAPGRAALAGALAGLGFAVKVSAALVVAGLAVALVLEHRDRGRREVAILLGSLGAGFAVVAGAAVAIGGSAMLTVTSRASDMVSIGSPWRTIRTVLHGAVGHGAAGDVVKYGAIALALVLAVLVVRRIAERRRVPAGAVPAGGPSAGIVPAGGPSAGGASAGAADGVPAGVWVVLALVVAWLFAWPYVLPWYDAFGWAFLALVPASGLDWLLLARTTALGLAYLPARTADVSLPRGLHWIQPVFRNGVSPVIITATVAALVAITIGNRYSALSDFGSVRSAGSAGGSDRHPDGDGRAPARHTGGEGMRGADRR